MSLGKPTHPTWSTSNLPRHSHWRHSYLDSLVGLRDGSLGGSELRCRRSLSNVSHQSSSWVKSNHTFSRVVDEYLCHRKIASVEIPYLHRSLEVYIARKDFFSDLLTLDHNPSQACTDRWEFFVGFDFSFDSSLSENFSVLDQTLSGALSLASAPWAFWRLSWSLAISFFQSVRRFCHQSTLLLVSDVAKSLHSTYHH